MLTELEFLKVLGQVLDVLAILPLLERPLEFGLDSVKVLFVCAGFHKLVLMRVDTGNSLV